MKILIGLAAAALALWAQADPAAAEQEQLNQALAEAGTSQVDFIRAIERHLRKYPQSRQRAELERALVRAALESRDQPRVVLYGERVLTREPENVELIERVSRYLLTAEDTERSTRALEYARKLERLMRILPKPSPGARGAARLAEEQQIILGKALVYQSRASGNLGKPGEAETLARNSYEVFPTAEAAREIARWLDRQGKTAEAMPHLADAFMIADPNRDESDRVRDRERLAEWRKKTGASEAALGELLLAAHDRTQARIRDFRAALRQLDPNAETKNPMEFTLSGLGGDKLALASLKGKVVVLDFWATWCAPCRAQQPLYEQVKEKFKENSSVAFLNINTDENRDLVKPFLDRNQWNKTIYFEDGLSALLRVSSIPTTFVVNGRGEISSRMNGYISERFVDMLTERIEEALAEK